MFLFYVSGVCSVMFDYFWLSVPEQLIAWKGSSPNDLLCVEWDVKPYTLTHSLLTQRRSIAKSVRCFLQRLFVCVFVCRHDNFGMSKHTMMKLGGRCIVQKSQPSSNVGS